VYTYIHTYIHCVSKKVSSFKLSVTLSNLNRLSKFLHCWKAYEICYKTVQHYPPHIRRVATLHVRFYVQSVWGKIRYFKQQKIATFVDEWSYRRLQMQFVCVFFHICRKFEFLISHGGVPTSLRWVGYCSNGFVANFIHCLAVQKFWKSFKIWQSYRRFKGRNFLRHSVFCIYTVSQKLHHIIFTIILSNQTVSIIFGIRMP